MHSQDWTPPAGVARRAPKTEISCRCGATVAKVRAVKSPTQGDKKARTARCPKCGDRVRLPDVGR